MAFVGCFLLWLLSAHGQRINGGQKSVDGFIGHGRSMLEHSPR
jgi:hypothetical protein